jgi:hypothetical protein
VDLGVSIYNNSSTILRREKKNLDHQDGDQNLITAFKWFGFFGKVLNFGCHKD